MKDNRFVRLVNCIVNCLYYATVSSGRRTNSKGSRTNGGIVDTRSCSACFRIRKVNKNSIAGSMTQFYIKTTVKVTFRKCNGAYCNSRRVIIVCNRSSTAYGSPAACKYSVRQIAKCNDNCLVRLVNIVARNCHINLFFHFARRKCQHARRQRRIVFIHGRSRRTAASFGIIHRHLVATGRIQRHLEGHRCGGIVMSLGHARRTDRDRRIIIARNRACSDY